MRRPGTVSRRAAVPAFLALSCVGAFVTAPAMAKDGADAAPADEAALAQRRDDDILVEGERIRQDASPKDVAPIIDTPKSIVLLDKSVIEQTGSANLQDALRTVPGITFGAAEGGNPIGDRPFIRGFDSQGSLYVDGVRDLASQTREVFAIESIQIVRGSDSTLGGRGSAGGTINILSKTPQPGNFGSVNASYGNGDYKRVTGDLNVQISDTVAARIQGLWHDQNVVDRDAIWSKRWGFAPSITIGLGTPTRLTASYYYLESHELPDSGMPFLYTIANAPGTGNIFTTPALGNVITAGGQTGYVARSNFYGLVDRDFRDSTTNQAMLRVEHDFGNVTLRNTARYSHSEQSYNFLLPDDSQGNVFGTAAINPAPATPGGLRGDILTGGYVWRRGNTRYGYSESIVDQTDLSGTFKTGGMEHSFAVGTEFSWEKTRRGALVSANGSTVSPRCNTATIARYYCTSLFNPNPYDPWVNYSSDTSAVQTPIVRGAPNTETQNDAQTQAIYGFDSITITPALILNLGARYDRFKSTVTLPFTAGTSALRLSRTDKLFNWQAGLVLKPTKETSLYASYATAATPPNTLLGEGREDNALPTTSSAVNLAILDALKVQKTKTYEVGAKGSLFGDKLALGLAVFQTDIDNARVQIDATTVGFLGKTRIRGVELTANGTILPGWTIFGGYTYLDPKIIDAGFAALTAPANGPAAAKIVYVPSVNTGKQVPQTAKNSFTLSTNYQATKRFSFGGGAYYMDRQIGGYADNRAATQTTTGVVTVSSATKVLTRGVPSYWRFDAQARYKLTDNVEIAVNAQNLTNKTYFSQTYTSHYAAIAPGRTVFGTVSLKF
ncbi:TonB-dependent receptor [Sphingomonas sp. So64.6b]|uniref:TonB-dependent receptor n=1 Tax=Sphingomonas sp. So64.6b TaxID=2997354 RepID=UPI001600DAB7|nr:TonB-dependent receptor [Sphingomonas sp. So64.6b]QNA86271.1 TonB-dependent receptor [Sphingomonas sp. So64.6b]